MDGEQLNGSDVIMQKILEHPAVASNLQDKEAFMDAEESQRWVKFARDDLASLLYPNICSTWNDSYVAFSYVNDIDTFSPFQKFAIQNLGSLAMYFAASKIKRKCSLIYSLRRILLLHHHHARKQLNILGLYLVHRETKHNR